MRITACLFASLIAGLTVAAGAPASSEVRQAYAARVEPICKANTPAIEHLLSGTRRMANHGQAVDAGRRFVKASDVFSATVREVATVHRPAAYSVRIGKWIARLHNVKEGLRRVGIALKRRNKLEALNRSGQLRDAGTSANMAVVGFHFRYCRIREARFS